jgi:DnaJ-class molecular chaperone
MTTPKAKTPEIRFAPIDDGRKEDCQCARCGSSVEYVDCDRCGGDGVYDLDDWEEFRRVMRRCSQCDGDGGWRVCLSPAEWCEANPIAGRERIQRGAFEWFDIPARPEPSDVR